MHFFKCCISILKSLKFVANGPNDNKLSLAYAIWTNWSYDDQVSDIKYLPL